MKTVLTIAGSDPSGGAGIQTDLLTFHALGVHGLSVITAVTAQNHKRFFSLNPVSSQLVREQLQAVAPLMVEGMRKKVCDAIKIGVLATEDNVLTVRRFIEQFQKDLGDRAPKIVLDPVFKSSTGHILLDPKGIAIMTQFLIPRVTLLTPNLDEAEILTKMKVRSVEAMREAALHIHTVYKGVQAVLIKGGHLKTQPVDVLFDGDDWSFFLPPKKFLPGVRGTGCALSAAIAAHLARGYSLHKSIERSKEFIAEYIRARV